MWDSCSPLSASSRLLHFGAAFKERYAGGRVREQGAGSRVLLNSPVTFTCPPQACRSCRFASLPTETVGSAAKSLTGICRLKPISPENENAAIPPSPHAQLIALCPLHCALARSFCLGQVRTPRPCLRAGRPCATHRAGQLPPPFPHPRTSTTFTDDNQLYKIYLNSV
jgi:hypothetical protein